MRFDGCLSVARKRGSRSGIPSEKPNLERKRLQRASCRLHSSLAKGVSIVKDNVREGEIARQPSIEKARSKDREVWEDWATGGTRVAGRATSRVWHQSRRHAQTRPE